MKRKFILLILILLTFVSPFMIVHADTAPLLTIHYQRSDQLYAPWDLWLWIPGQEGADYAFDGVDDDGAYKEIPLIGAFADLTSLGIIVKKEVDGNWVKDVSEDRYIDLTLTDEFGNVDAYLLEGESEISYPNSDPRIMKAFFNDDLDISFQISQDIEAADLTISKNGNVVGYTGFTSGSSDVITLNEAVDTTAIYKITIDHTLFHDESIIIFGADYDSQVFADAYHYDGWLGYQYTVSETTFRLWAPISSEVSINLYEAGHTTASRSDGVNTPYDVIALDYIGQGVWETTITEDLHEVYYTYNVTNDGTMVQDIPDPYGVTFGLNGQRSMVVDFDAVNPEGWDQDQGVKGYDSINDWIIYELHVRDLTTHSSWQGPEQYRGTFMGLTVAGTTYTNTITGVTVSTGLDHLVELGITHLHLLPTFDQDSYNNEANFQFNWGYNPQNFNSPEGGYSTDPYHGSVRVNEFKQMVQALHAHGINVVLDSVYNHTGNGVNFSMNRIIPNYIYRLDPSGNFSNGTGVGNETASERYMFRKFMVDSAVFWSEAYHVDGFRFDLMAVHDVVTMNELTDAVKAVNEESQVYGEPWGGGTIALPYNQQAGKNNLYQMPDISAFNDQFRDTIKGSTFSENDPGYITNGESASDVKKGITGSINWSWGETSSQSVNYISAHDNLTLYDKLLKANNKTSYSTEIDYQARLGNSIVLLSQGVPFLHAGVDFLRTKGGNENSYNASDAVNQLNWIRKSLYTDSFEYYKGMIALRKAYESFKMTDPTDINNHLSFLNLSGYGLIGYELTKNDEHLLIYHNSGSQNHEITLPSGAWQLLANQQQVDLEGIATYQNTFPIHKAETLVFIPGNPEDVVESPTLPPEITNTVSVAYETANIIIQTSSAVDAYQIDGGQFVTLDAPSTAISLGMLSVGTHEIIVRNASGELSEPFTMTILENTTQTDPVIILNEETTFEAGDIIVIELSRDVIQYKLNDGDYINLNAPSNTINLVGLAVGVYEIQVRDADHVTSDVYAFEVVEAEIPVEPDTGCNTGCNSELSWIQTSVLITFNMLALMGLVGLFLRKKF